MKRVPKICLYLYIVGIFVLAFISFNNATNTKLNSIYVLTLRIDYLIHSGLFLFLMFLISRAYSISFGQRTKLAVLWIILALILAIIAEGIQFFITYRAFNINDLLANILGVVLGMVFFIKKKN